MLFSGALYYLFFMNLLRFGLLLHLCLIGLFVHELWPSMLVVSQKLEATCLIQLWDPLNMYCHKIGNVQKPELPSATSPLPTVISDVLRAFSSPPQNQAGPVFKFQKKKKKLINKGSILLRVSVDFNVFN